MSKPKIKLIFTPRGEHWVFKEARVRGEEISVAQMIMLGTDMQPNETQNIKYQHKDKTKFSD